MYREHVAKNRFEIAAMQIALMIQSTSLRRRHAEERVLCQSTSPAGMCSQSESLEGSPWKELGRKRLPHAAMRCTRAHDPGPGRQARAAGRPRPSDTRQD